MYLYKKNRYYFYKRRIPYTNYFYSFNTKLTNCKKATKLVIIFNKLTRNIFEYLKKEGKNLSLDYTEILTLLNDYKEKALLENQELEEQRHNHLSKLFKVEKDDPILGKITLSGGQSEVIDKALATFEHLAVGSFNETKTALKKHGKDVVKRTTLELRNLYNKLRNSNNEINLLHFLSMLFKTEAEILLTDKQRVINRFSDNFTQYNTNVKNSSSDSYIEEQIYKNIPIEEVETDFLYNTCSYTSKMLDDSKSNASKVRKITQILTDYIKDKKREPTTNSITIDVLREIIKIIPLIPLKPSNSTKSYNFYLAYKTNKDFSKDNLRSVKTIKTDLNAFKRYVNYLANKKYISADNNNELMDYFSTTIRQLSAKVNKNEIRDKENAEPFKDDMLQKIFNKEYRPYKILFKKLSNPSFQEDKDILIAKFYVPIIMFFTGSRVSELVHLKTSDCDIEIVDKIEKLVLYIEANEQKGLKAASSKRIILVHDFLANELNLIDFVKKAKREGREYLFNTMPKDEAKISKEFNRNKDYLDGTLTKRDEFLNARYSLYSFRHTFKTHMLSLNINETVINKIQGHADEKVADGYFSLTNELLEPINSFRKHKIIDWEDFIRMTNNFLL